MHRCLKIPEIIQLIFAGIDHNAALAALARTCPSFRDPALDLLWETQHHFFNILNCFPAGLTEKVRDNDEAPLHLASLDEHLLESILNFL